MQHYHRPMKSWVAFHQNLSRVPSKMGRIQHLACARPALAWATQLWTFQCFSSSDQPKPEPFSGWNSRYPRFQILQQVGSVRIAAHRPLDDHWISMPAGWFLSVIIQILMKLFWLFWISTHQTQNFGQQACIKARASFFCTKSTRPQFSETDKCEILREPSFSWCQ